jgi:ribokinase
MTVYEPHDSDADPISPRLCVVGSVNVDFVASCHQLPERGETVTNATFAQHQGGKGANQALAASRLGARVSLLAAVGADSLADYGLALLRESTVDLSRIVVHEGEPTGIAMILVEASGENQIVVAPGANRSLTASDVDVQDFDVVLCQLEVTDEVVGEAARQCSGLFVLNAAPARPLAGSLLQRADVIIVNASEHASLAGDLAEFKQLLIVTRGAAGAEAYRAGRQVARAGSPSILAIDTVGAGDAFCAAMAVTLAMGVPLQGALELGCAAGALAASAEGAQRSLPTRADVDQILRKGPKSPEQPLNPHGDS